MYNWHLFTIDGGYFAFHPDSYSLVDLDSQTYECIKLLQDNLSIEEVVRQTGLASQDVSDLSESLSKYGRAEMPQTELNCRSRRVARITLHVTNDCNLRCRYCYACGGSYNGERKVMDHSTADNFIRFVTEYFDCVDTIVFFGGEPLLNVAVISHVCEKLTSLYERGDIPFLPRFGLITNGYFSSEEVFRLIERYLSFVTVSIDGDARSHDLNRITATGRGSFSRVEAFVDRLRSFRDVAVRYEATYTQEHAKLGISREDVRSFIESRFQIDGVVNNEYTMEQDISMSSSYDKANEDRAFWNILPAIIRKKSVEMCPIARGIFSISVDGDIYPCHMNTGEDGASLGNISGKHLFNSSEEYKSYHPYIEHSVKNNLICVGCWARNLCGGCTRLWFYSEKEHKYKDTPNETICSWNRKHLEGALGRVVRTRRNPQAWQSLIKTIQTGK